ncbi:MAG TPA: heterodisulfide reductase-related iron-sulfur binding cluster [Methanotrichaceae archaeon]|nr:heterodisulfide reductase-related iron-sulfur binding cluster [Methanotrichaceae archaeon]
MSNSEINNSKMNDYKMNLDLRSINKCIRCGTCRSVCPVFEEEGWESSSTRGRMLVMKRLADGRQAYDEDLKSLNTCTTCGVCSESCPAGVIPQDLIMDSRRELASLGVMTMEQMKLAQAINDSGNALGDTSSRLSWLEGKSLVPEKADYVYFAGCLSSYRYPESASRTFEVLRRFGATVLRDEKCCGSPLIRTGFPAARFVDHNTAQIESTGAHTVITGCAGCYATLKKDYPKSFKVQSIPEFLADRIPELGLKRLDLTVSYHDPCHLGRYHHVYEQPRQVIEAICNLKEMKSSREKSRCCGGGGGVRAGYKDLSLRMAKRRLKDVPEGVDYIITSCPLCIRNLNDAGGKAMDLLDLVARAIKQS